MATLYYLNDGKYCQRAKSWLLRHAAEASHHEIYIRKDNSCLSNTSIGRDYPTMEFRINFASYGEAFAFLDRPCLSHCTESVHFQK